MMTDSEAPTQPIIGQSVYGSTKREILLMLKREGQTDLQSLAEHLHISKMAVHKHVRELENH